MDRRQCLRSFGLAASGAVVALVLAASCSDSQTLGAVAAGCQLNSECNDQLVCTFGRCHQACLETRDCPLGQRCVVSGTLGVCVLPDEAKCSATLTCAGSLVCASDQQCRAACPTGSGCLRDQICINTQASGSAACFDTPELDGSAGDSGSGGDATTGADGASSNDGAGGLDGNEGGRDGGGIADVATDVVVTPCVSSQTQFGNIAQGDSNPSFTSGVGLRTADQLIIFSAYSVPAQDAGGGAVSDAGATNWIYAQAFDPVTAKSRGPAAPLFQAPPGDGFFIEDVSIASSGQVALLFNYGGFRGTQISMGGNGVQPLYAAFLAPSADAGAAGLTLGQIILVESAPILGQPHIIWSVSAQAFVSSWQYYAAPSWQIKVRKFLPDGRGAGGNTDTVPTDNGAISYGNGETSVATVGSLIGVGYISYARQTQTLTVLDARGNELGSPVNLAPETQGYWIATAGTSQGFVNLYGIGGGGETVAGIYVPTSPDAGPPVISDGGDAATFPRFAFPRASPTIDGRAVSDGPGGAGGVGAVILYSNGASFVYVNADGTTRVGPNQVIAHAYAAGDFVAVTNFGGSFGVSLHSSAAHSTQVAASGCSP